MSARVVNCPNCGGQVEFKAGSSLLSVCPYCSSAVARLGDDIGELEILGRVAPLADLGSPLALGVSGRWGRLGFTLVGHVQYDHGAGPWNEWHAAFDDGRWGWISEAQGRVYVTFGYPRTDLPSWSEARVGARFSIGEHTLTIVEKKAARFVSAEGEIPFAAAPGAVVRYCDVQGGQGVFGTLDYSEGDTTEMLFLGQELSYQDLFSKDVLRDVAPAQAAAAAGLNCPNCGASVEVKAPDEAKRITCGTCDSLLDASKGSELYLLTSAVPRIPEPLIPLGAQGKIDGVVHTVYGQLVKSVEVWGDKYLWTEYLLRRHGGAWRWLVEADGHWSYVEPIDAGDLSMLGGRVVRLDGTNHLRFSSASARVEGLRGEFYWKVGVGDRAGATDFVRPPVIISEERTAEEVTYSRGRYMEPEVVQEAFRLERSLPRPQGIAPHQPNPHGRSLRNTVRLAVVLSVLTLVFAMGRALFADEEVVAEVEAPFEPTSKVSSPNASIPGKPLPPILFELDEQSNLAVHVNADVDAGIVFLNGQLVDEARADTRPLGIRLERYGGYSGGEAWASGARARTVFLGERGPGRQQLRLTPEFLGSAARKPSRIRVEVVADVFIGTHALVVGALLWVLPLIGVFRYFGFEKRRWSESDFAE